MKIEHIISFTDEDIGDILKAVVTRDQITPLGYKWVAKRRYGEWIVEVVTESKQKQEPMEVTKEEV